MKNSIGNNLILTVFGESHGPSVGVVLDGMAPGVDISEKEVADFLSVRRPSDCASTARQEPDDFQILSGVFEGHTTGAPICIVIPNTDVRSKDYEALRGIARPSHADYTANVKYSGFEDYRGGGHFSGRVTAGIVAAGAIACKALAKRGISVGTHLLRCGNVRDSDLLNAESIGNIGSLSTMDFPLLDLSKKDAFMSEIMSAKKQNDSIGGIVQTAVTGLPAGLGEPWFDSVEGSIAKAVFAIGGVKGLEFGRGFGFASGLGSQLNDPFVIADGKVRTSSNNNGGVNGGITNGMPVIFNTAVKPTPSIAKPQQTVNFSNMSEQTVTIEGRHDAAIVRRIPIVITSITAITICDLLATAYGTDWLK